MTTPLTSSAPGDGTPDWLVDKQSSPVGKGTPAQKSLQDHFNDDVDSHPHAHHHTLGRGPNQAMPGDASVGVSGLDVLVKQGPAGIATNVFPAGLRVPSNFTTSGWYLRCNPSHGPTGSACTLVVKRATITIATISIAAGSITGSVSTAVALAAGDLLYFDFTSVGSTTPAWDIALQVL